jgi:4'-phosphopantetheinyl transferase
MDPDICHVWLVDVGTLESKRWFCTLRDVLSQAELERMSCFVFDQDRNIYAMTHLLARYALTSCAPDIAPNVWVFEQTSSGRPEIAHPRMETRLRFNISHTQGFIACIVTAELDCGIDIERINHNIDLASLVNHILTASEIDSIGAQPDSARAESFLCRWTIKEAYAKARGLGLTLPFNRIAVDLEPPIRVTLEPPRESETSPWQLNSWMTNKYAAAVAICLRRLPLLRVITHVRIQ